MKIENCPFAKSCDNNEGKLWFCGHRTFCPYERCEMPAEPERKQTIEEIKAKIIVPVKPEPVKEKRGRKAKYDWDRALPKMQKMRDAAAPWGDIAKATGVPEASLIRRWSQEGMTIRTGVGD